MSEPTGPMRASEVEARTEKDSDQLDRERARAAVKAKSARREAIRAAGGDIAVGTDTNIGNLEKRLAKKSADLMRKHRARAAVTKRLGPGR